MSSNRVCEITENGGGECKSRTAKYLLSSKGKNLLVYDDFIFRRKSKLGGRSYWICAYDRGYRCKARLCVLDGSMPPKILTQSGNHSHRRECGRVEAREMVNTLKREAMESDKTIDQIYSSCVNIDKLSERGLVAMSSKAAVKAAMRRARLRSSQSGDDEIIPVENTFQDTANQSSFRSTNCNNVRTEMPVVRNKRKGTPRKVTVLTQEESEDDELEDFSYLSFTTTNGEKSKNTKLTE